MWRATGLTIVSLDASSSSGTHGRNEFEQKLRKTMRLASNANSDNISIGYDLQFRIMLIVRKIYVTAKCKCQYRAN